MGCCVFHVHAHGYLAHTEENLHYSLQWAYLWS